MREVTNLTNLTNPPGVRPLENLTIMDDYLFGIVMGDMRNLKPLLEAVLGVRIKKIKTVETQRSEKPGYKSRGIRMDLYAEDDEGQLFNAEVQKVDKGNLPKRIRYYQSTIDITVLAPGADYKKLRKSCVIFICGFDYFKKDRYLYTFSNSCREDPGLELEDETLKIVVNITGKVGDISPELREIIHYFQTGEPGGAYTRQLEEAVNKVKTSEERRREYMIAMCREMEIREEGREEGIREGHREGRKEGHREGRREGIRKGREEGTFSTLISLVKKGILSVKTAAEEAGVSEEEFTKRYLKKA